jgi:hypothetical protein
MMPTTQEDGHPGGTPEGNEQHRRPLGGSWSPSHDWLRPYSPRATFLQPWVIGEDLVDEEVSHYD